jgi:hypothetical protein
MPRLILRGDDGRELVGFDVSPAAVRTIAAFLRRHRPAFEAAAAVKRAYEQAAAAVAPAPRAPRRVRR